MGKIIYNKVKSGKYLGGGGPRDRQTALRLKQQQEMLINLRPAMTAKVSKAKPAFVETQQKVAPAPDMSQYMPLKEVKKKIEEAVASVRAMEQQKFQSGLNNINNQLKNERKKAAKVSEELIKVTATMKIKEEMFGKSDGAMKELQDKMDKIYNKIADGSIKHLVGSKMDRPALEDKIFIDPLEKGKEPKLDAHIEIKEEKPAEDAEERDMMTDLAKLKGLLKLD